MIPHATPSRGITRIHHNLTTFYNPDPSIHHDSDDEIHFAMMTLQNEYSYALASIGNPEYNPAPYNYRDAMNRKDTPKWWNSMCVEFFNMHDKNVWRITKKIDVPTGRKIIGNRWVYS